MSHYFPYLVSFLGNPPTVPLSSIVLPFPIVSLLQVGSPSTVPGTVEEKRGYVANGF
jgi:hypothetical protein